MIFRVGTEWTLNIIFFKVEGLSKLRAVKVAAFAVISSWMNWAAGPRSASLYLLKSVMALVVFMGLFVVLAAIPSQVTPESYARPGVSHGKELGIGLVSVGLLSEKFTYAGKPPQTARET